MTGIEPASSAWKAEVIAIIRHPHVGNTYPITSCDLTQNETFIFIQLSAVYAKNTNCAAPPQGFEPQFPEPESGVLPVVRQGKMRAHL